MYYFCLSVSDIELILNEKGEPQPVVQYEGLFEGHSEGTTPLPKNFHRFVFLFLGFVLCSIYPIGFLILSK